MPGSLQRDTPNWVDLRGLALLSANLLASMPRGE
jgi:hypothetical protein